MFLSRLLVENYRAIRRAELSFDSTTLLIGENEIGKSSLLEILMKTLDGNLPATKFTFRPDHFHKINNEPAGPILLQMTFREESTGQWGKKSYQPLKPFLDGESNSPRHFILAVSAQPGHGGEVVDWTVRFGDDREPIKDLALVEWIRRFKLVIHLPAGMLTGHGVENIQFSKERYSGSNVPPQVLEWTHQIEESSIRILTGTSTNSAREISMGFRASKKLVEYFRNVDRRHLALEVEGGLDFPEEGGEIPNAKSANQRLGILLLVAAWIRASSDIFEFEADPIWLVEDPEAHLHPITLASMGELFSSIKGQKIISTYSDELVSAVPIFWTRRLTRKKGLITEYKVDPSSLSKEDVRRIRYHLGARNSDAWFARVWLLVEGESEYWILPRMGEVLGYNFRLEGIECVEFAQSGLASVIKLADQLGIHWHLLTDGDEAGQSYIKTARGYLNGRKEESFLTSFPEPDIEHCFWNHGFSDFYVRHARVPEHKKDPKTTYVIKRAIKNHSKPFLSVAISKDIEKLGKDGVPGVVQQVVETCVKIARRGVQTG